MLHYGHLLDFVTVLAAHGMLVNVNTNSSTTTKMFFLAQVITTPTLANINESKNDTNNIDDINEKLDIILNTTTEMPTIEKIKELLSSANNKQTDSQAKDFTRLKKEIRENKFQTKLKEKEQVFAKELKDVKEENVCLKNDLKRVKHDHEMMKYRHKITRRMLSSIGFIFIRKTSIITLRTYYDRLDSLTKYLESLFAGDAAKYRSNDKVRLVDSDPDASK